MIPLVFGAASVVAALWPFHSGQLQTRDYALPAWGYSISKDRFTGKIACRLYVGSRRQPSISYANRALSFRFPSRLSTVQADYKLDSGTSKPWRDSFPALTGLGISLDTGSLANPTGGLVILPAATLAGVHTVTIRPTSAGQPKTFSIDGFPDALEAARVRGCHEDDFVQ